MNNPIVGILLFLGAWIQIIAALCFLIFVLPPLAALMILIISALLLHGILPFNPSQCLKRGREEGEI